MSDHAVGSTKLLATPASYSADAPSYSRDVLLFVGGTSVRLSPRQCQTLERQLREARRQASRPHRPSLRSTNEALLSRWYAALARHAVIVTPKSLEPSHGFVGPFIDGSFRPTPFIDGAAEVLCADVDRFVTNELVGKRVAFVSGPRVHVVDSVGGPRVYWRADLSVSDASVNEDAAR